MGRSLAVALYLAAARLAEGPARRLIAKRVERGKEDKDRLDERFGIASRPRPEGQLIWFHAASVGESLSLMTLIEAILEARPRAHILVTTGTATSASLLEERLPGRAIHQFTPIDTTAAVRRFLDHWKPDLAVWTESELWPSLICRTAATGCPMILINARISRRSARRYRWAGSFAASLLNRFDAILAQDDVIADRIYALGADPVKIEVSGSLKDTAEPLPHDAAELKTLTKGLSGRSVWLAASTHEGEEEIAAEAHRFARRRAPGLILIIAPRHPDRGPEIARGLRADGWQVACRSMGEALDRNTEIYLADTLGEMGLWYRLAAISFVGGSLVEVGGHNPFEPALLGSAILHGPQVQNFETAYQRFHRASAAVLVETPEDLGPKLVETLPADRAAALAAAAWVVSSEGADVVRRVQDVIDAHLPPEPG